MPQDTATADAQDTVTLDLPGLEPRWLALIKAAIAQRGRGGVTQVALAMGVSRVYVARVLMTGPNRIAKPSPAFVGRALAAFGGGRVDCPHLGVDIAKPECDRFAARTWAQIQGTGPDKVLHWRACQSCPQNCPQPSPTPAKEARHGNAA